MIAAWIFGLWLVYLLGAWSDPWMHVKFAAVLGLSAMHGMMSRWVKTFAADANTRSPKFYRIMNEVPTLLMIVVVIMVIVKPF